VLLSDLAQFLCVTLTPTHSTCLPFLAQQHPPTLLLHLFSPLLLPPLPNNLPSSSLRRLTLPHRPTLTETASSASASSLLPAGRLDNRFPRGLELSRPGRAPSKASRAFRCRQGAGMSEGTGRHLVRCSREEEEETKRGSGGRGARGC
jgi:hypothetical protein